MALTLTTVTRARRKAAFSAISTDVVTDFLEAAEDWVQSYCDREFITHSHTGYYNGHGGKRLYLRNVPVSSISAATITLDDGTVETLTPSTDLTFQAANGAVEFGPNNTSSFDVWPSGFKNISITYTAGYTLGTDLPYAIEEAVILRALVLFAESGEDMNAALLSQTVGEGTKQRVTPYITDGWMEQVYSLLAPYRRLESPACGGGA